MTIMRTNLTKARWLDRIAAAVLPVGIGLSAEAQVSN